MLTHEQVWCPTPLFQIRSVGDFFFRDLFCRFFRRRLQVFQKMLDQGFKVLSVSRLVESNFLVGFDGAIIPRAFVLLQDPTSYHFGGRVPSFRKEKMTERRWAVIGRIITYGGGLVTLILALVQLGERFIGPNLTGVYASYLAALNPHIEDELKERIEGSEITNLITKSQEKEEPPDKIVADIQKLLNDSEERGRRDLLTELSLRNFRYLVTLQIQNQGTQLATNVRVLLPGRGTAKISERGPYFLDAESLRWNREISLGDIRPGGEMHLQIWPDDIGFGVLQTDKPALVSNEGAGKLQEALIFYGWGASAMRSFLSAPFSLKLVSFFVLLLVLLVPVWLLVRSGNMHFGRRSQTSRPIE